MGTRTTVIAPVGPLTWNREPPKIAAKNPATIAVMRPAPALMPVVIPKARASGSATTPTAIPANKSSRHDRNSKSLLRGRNRFTSTG
ncbi:unannotated protein [freshwater metagenome]|uniref:Unannotated protein n=1 Tax=freshwater metagenome TaxID=449393 RepID=A0A6J6QNC6_9ZZZZ